VARVRHERPPAARPLRRIGHRGDAALDVVSRADHREEDALRAGVQRHLDLGPVDARHAHERRARGPAGGGDHRLHRLAADRPVLTVHDEEVGTGGGDRLRGDRRGDRAEDAVEEIALAGEPLLQEHRG